MYCYQNKICCIIKRRDCGILIKRYPVTKAVNIESMSQSIVSYPMGLKKENEQLRSPIFVPCQLFSTPVSVINGFIIDSINLKYFFFNFAKSTVFQESRNVKLTLSCDELFLFFFSLAEFRFSSPCR